METVEIKSINWGERARSDYGDIKGLAKSMKEFGLIQPIVLSEDNTLLAGGRRTSAAIQLGWTEIPFMRIEALDPMRRKEIELEENLRRKELTWQEQTKLRAEIHKLRIEIAEAEDHRIKDTAKDLDIGESMLQKDLQLAKDVKDFPELLTEKDRKTAVTKARRFRESQLREIIAASSERIADIHRGDAIEVMKTIPNESIDLVLFDPPYGVNLQDGGKTPKGNWVDGWAKTYDDTTQNAILLMDGVLEQIARVLKPGAHCYLFFALQLEIETRAISETIQKYLNYQRSPLMWVKNTHSNKDPYKRFGITYEPIYFCWKGGTPRDLMKAHHSVFNIPVNTKGKQHPNEKPEELYKKLISLSTHPKEVVLDPTAGSGRSLTSAVQLGRHPIGIEKDSDWFNLMESNIRAAKEERDGRKS